MIHEIIMEIQDEDFHKYGLEGCREVVRCKDCKHYDKPSCFLWDGDIDGYNYGVPGDNDYCSRADRMVKE